MIDPFGFISMRKVDLSPVLEDSPIHLSSNLIRSSWPGVRDSCDQTFKATFCSDASGREFMFIGIQQMFGSARSAELVAAAEEIKRFQPDRVLIEMPKEKITVSYSSLENEEQKRFKPGQEWHPVIAAVTSTPVRGAVLGGDPSFDQVRRILARFTTREDQLVYSSIRILLSLKRRGVLSSQWDAHFFNMLREEVSEYRIGNWSFRRFQEYLALKMNATIEQLDESWLEPRTGQDVSRTQTMAAAIEMIRGPMILRAAEDAINKSRRSMMIYSAPFYIQFAPAFEKAFGKPMVQLLKQSFTTRNGS